MEQYMFDKINGIWYKLEGDYYIPCVTSAPVPQNWSTMS